MARRNAIRRIELIRDMPERRASVDFRLADFDDVQLHVAAGHLGELRTQLLDVRALLADDTRTGA
jgi:tRNA threonylcarbamoyladenosine modification (KEOPS) complex  Pcc1 subunit